MSELIQGIVVTERGVMPGAVRLEGGIITAVEPPGAAAGTPERFILPGFIDAHVHGGGGGDTMDGPDGVRTLAAFHLRHGTTTILPTTMTNPWEAVMAALHGVAEVREQLRNGGAAGPPLPDIPGAHLEGPFISPQRLGAQPDFAVLPGEELVDQVLATGTVRVVTLAPELAGAPAAAARFAAAGTRVSLGHSVASWEDAVACMEAVAAAGGAAGFTHLYNAMGGLEGRRPGLVGAALSSRFASAELILDLLHVHAASARAAAAALPGRLMLITDAIRATGLGDGESELGGQPVTVRDGRATLADGTLAGSVLTMDQAVRNARASGWSLPEIASLAAGAAARYLGLHDRGSLEPGLRADVVLLDADLQVERVYVAGVPAA